MLCELISSSLCLETDEEWGPEGCMPQGKVSCLFSSFFLEQVRKVNKFCKHDGPTGCRKYIPSPEPFFHGPTPHATSLYHTLGSTAPSAVLPWPTSCMATIWTTAVQQYG